MISLKEERLKRGLTVNRVAKEVGYSHEAVSNIEERGFLKKLYTPIARDLCDYYNLDYYEYLKENMPIETFGERMKFVRYLTVRSLNTFEKPSFSTVFSEAERGVTFPGADKIIYFAKETGVNLNWLLLGEGHIFRGGSRR